MLYVSMKHRLIMQAHVTYHQYMNCLSDVQTLNYLHYNRLGAAYKLDENANSSIIEIYTVKVGT